MISDHGNTKYLTKSSHETFVNYWQSAKKNTEHILVIIDTLSLGQWNKNVDDKRDLKLSSPRQMDGASFIIPGFSSLMKVLHLSNKEAFPNLKWGLYDPHLKFYDENYFKRKLLLLCEQMDYIPPSKELYYKTGIKIPAALDKIETIKSIFNNKNYETKFSLFIFVSADSLFANRQTYYGEIDLHTKAHLIYMKIPRVTVTPEFHSNLQGSTLKPKYKPVTVLIQSIHSIGSTNMSGTNATDTMRSEACSKKNEDYGYGYYLVGASSSRADGIKDCPFIVETASRSGTSIPLLTHTNSLYIALMLIRPEMENFLTLLELQISIKTLNMHIQEYYMEHLIDQLNEFGSSLRLRPVDQIGNFFKSKKFGLRFLVELIKEQITLADFKFADSDLMINIEQYLNLQIPTEAFIPKMGWNVRIYEKNPFWFSECCAEATRVYEDAHVKARQNDSMIPAPRQNSQINFATVTSTLTTTTTMMNSQCLRSEFKIVHKLS